MAQGEPLNTPLQSGGGGGQQSSAADLAVFEQHAHCCRQGVGHMNQQMAEGILPFTWPQCYGPCRGS